MPLNVQTKKNYLYICLNYNNYFDMIVNYKMEFNLRNNLIFLIKHEVRFGRVQNIISNFHQDEALLTIKAALYINSKINALFSCITPFHQSIYCIFIISVGYYQYQNFLISILSRFITTYFKLSTLL